MKTRGIILAAGRGSRMGESTARKHKCLTVLNGETLLHWQLESLNMANLDEIVVVRGYKAEMLVGEFKVVDNPRWAETNMVRSLYCADGYKGDTIISYSDIVYHPKHIENLKKSKADITITADLEWFKLWSQRFEDPLEDAETFKSENSNLIEIGGKTQNLKDIEAQYMGLLKLTEKGWSQMYQVYDSFTDEGKDKLDMTSLLNAMLKKNVNISIVFIKGGWCEVDNNEDVKAYEEGLKDPSEWLHYWR